MAKQPHPRESDALAHLEQVERLLLENPRAAHSAARSLPALVDGLDRGVRAHAYACLGSAHFKAGEELLAAEAFAVAAELATGTSATVRALVKFRATALSIGAGRYAEAETALQEALQLASEEPTGALLGRIQMKCGTLEFRRSHFAKAAEHCAMALDTLPANHYLRPCAAWNLMLAVYHLDHRQARSLLGFMSYHELRCRRRLSKRRKKTVPDCMICWTEGYLCGVLGYLPHAERCLSWAASALFELGAAREAALCALDLISFEPGGFGKVHQIVSALADDMATTPTVRDAARLWLASTGKDQAKILRDHLMQERKAGVESD